MSIVDELSSYADKNNLEDDLEKIFKEAREGVIMNEKKFVVAFVFSKQKKNEVEFELQQYETLALSMEEAIGKVWGSLALNGRSLSMTHVIEIQ